MVFVTVTDELAARDNPCGFLDPAAVDNLFDYNKDGYPDIVFQGRYHCGNSRGNAAGTHMDRNFYVRSAVSQRSALGRLFFYFF